MGVFVLKTIGILFVFNRFCVNTNLKLTKGNKIKNTIVIKLYMKSLLQ